MRRRSVVTGMHDGKGGGMLVVRRTFEAARHPKGSDERARLNLDWLTSEYMPSHRYGIRNMDGSRINGVSTYRTQREASEKMLELGRQERARERWARLFDPQLMASVTESDEIKAELMKRWDCHVPLLQALRECYEVIDEVTAENMADYIGVDRVTDAYQAARAALALAEKGGQS